MYRRSLVIVLAAAMCVSLAGCHNKKVQNPIAEVNSKQPDKVLFDRSMDAMKHNKFEVARMTLQTLINTYPDSEFVARAKLAIGDSWYAEGGTAALAQAENEYNDFKTFFPNMPEAAEAQMKIAKIHYDQMEKADRDFTHAKRAEGAYRDLIQEFPDSPLVPRAKERLREVQEVLAQREFLIGRFYYMRQSYPAAIARLASAADTYPLFSGADETLYMLGQCYEGEISLVRASNVAEVNKGRLIKELQDKAAIAYSRIITRYPVSDRAVEAKARLQEMHRPVPVPTPEAIALNKAEEDSRGHTSFSRRLMETFHKHPDTAETARVGEPTMADPKSTDAPQFMKHATDVLSGKADTSTKSVSIEQIGTGAPPPNQAPPRSDDQVGPSAPPQDNSIPELPVNTGAQSPSAPPAQSSATTQQSAQVQSGADPAPATPPAQVNDINSGSTGASASSGTQQSQSSDQNTSSSKKKKKKGLGKLNPF
jgi:outer membrane protein assembly factor BamD